MPHPAAGVLGPFENWAASVLSGSHGAVTEAKPAQAAAFLEGAARRLAFAVPLVVTMLRTSPTGQWRDDLPVVRALGLVPSGAEGMISTALTQLLALLPIGGRLLRAGLVSALGLALATAIAYRLIHPALNLSIETPRLSPVPTTMWS